MVNQKQYYILWGLMEISATIKDLNEYRGVGLSYVYI